jgi:hypothetical protein
VLSATEVWNPFPLSSCIRRSAFARLAKTPSCTIQPAAELVFSADAASAAGFSAAAYLAGFFSGAEGLCAATGGFSVDLSAGATFSAAAGFRGAAGCGSSRAASPCAVEEAGFVCGVTWGSSGEGVGEELPVEADGCEAASDSSIGAGCAGPLACGVDVLALAPVCESSARFIVYERNGGSSEEVAAACGTGADREGPLSSSGTNNTISTTRMIAPVSRSFTRLSKMGAEPLQSTVGFAVGGELAQYIPSHCSAGPTV